METFENKPIVTVITVCYNAGKEIEKTLLSVISQSYNNIEFIVIDGGSSDDTVTIIKRYSTYIQYFVSEPDKGIYDAMNKAINHSHGKWLNFMNAGDVFYDDRVIEKVISFAPFNERVKVLYGDVCMKYQDRDGFIKRLNKVQQIDVQFNLNHQSTMIEGNWMREMQYDISYKIAADVDFFNKTNLKGFEFMYIPVVISIYECSSGISAVNQMLLFDEIMRIKGIKKGSFLWLKGFLRAKIFFCIHHIPFGMGERFLAFYVKRRVS